MKDFLRNLNDFFIKIYLTIRSMILLPLYSSIKVVQGIRKMRMKNSNTKTCVVLGNGPSLRDVLDNDTIERGDYFAVNQFVDSSYFNILKPCCYFLTDSEFFNPTNERCRANVERLVNAFNKVDWIITVFYPTQCEHPENLLNRITNHYVNFVKINTIQIDGFEGFRHFIYKHYLGMPLCQTVLHAALMTAINLNYKKIYLYGADHSWTKDLRVDEDNVVCYGDRHVYDTNLTTLKMNYNIAYLLDCYSSMFKSHYLIRDYADKMGIEIINKTKGSFVDAYKRI